MSDTLKLEGNNSKRCEWLNEDKEYIKYHDEEWGVPQHNKFILFEMLCLEGQQAGLSWLTILKKRDNYRKLFCKFNPYKISKYKEKDVEQILKDNGIVRHRGKILSVINNSKSLIKMESNGEEFSSFIWRFVDNKPIVNNWKASIDIPTQTSVSVSMSKALKKRGFTFVGPTTCYSFMQACGLVNDHLIECVCRRNYI